jgi:hypothetical protein
MWWENPNTVIMVVCLAVMFSLCFGYVVREIIRRV